MPPSDGQQRDGIKLRFGNVPIYPFVNQATEIQIFLLDSGQVKNG